MTTAARIIFDTGSFRVVSLPHRDYDGVETRKFVFEKMDSDSMGADKWSNAIVNNKDVWSILMRMCLELDEDFVNGS